MQDPPLTPPASSILGWPLGLSKLRGNDQPIAAAQPVAAPASQQLYSPVQRGPLHAPGITPCRRGLSNGRKAGEKEETTGMGRVKREQAAKKRHEPACWGGS